MRCLRACALLSCLASAGCGEGQSFWISISFPDEASKLQTRILHLYAIEPGWGADCQKLLNGSAIAGDTGFLVEDEISIDLTGISSTPTLSEIGPGLRLFFGQAEDSEKKIFLLGCTGAEAGGEGSQEIAIQLKKICTSSGSEKCDNLDNDCDGETDNGNSEDLCPALDNARATSCSMGQCGYICNPPWVNANQDWADGCECHPTRQSQEWCDSLDNDCDGTTDGPDCIQCQNPGECVDLTSCLQGSCNGGICSTETVADGEDCDDSAFCTINDKCSQGFCLGTERDCSVSDACRQGVCDETIQSCATEPTNEGKTCDDSFWCTQNDLCQAGSCIGQTMDCSSLDEPCKRGVCDDATQGCITELRAEGEVCSDGYDCTTVDQCNSGGNCVGTPDPNFCAGGLACKPDCTPEGTGCVNRHEACGPDCINCTAQATNKVCRSGQCGCETINDCQAGDQCIQDQCSSCVPDCMGKCDGALSNCSTPCNDPCPDGLWCVSQTCRPCDNPVDVNATDGEDGKATISFTTPEAPISECLIRRNTGSFPTNHSEGTPVDNPLTQASTFVSITDTGLQNQTAFFYAVFCRNQETWNDALDAEQPYVNADTATPRDATPQNPTDVLASDGEDSRSTISFTMPNAPVSDCQLRRDTAGFPSGHGAGTPIGVAQTGAGQFKMLSDTSLANGTTYFYAVYCRNGASWNDTLDATPPGNADSALPVAKVIAFDSSSSMGEHSGNTTLSFSHTIGGGFNRLLIVGLSCGESGWQPTPTVTFAGQTMTLITRRESTNTSAAVWYLLNPPSGTNSVSITGLSSYVDGKIAGSVSFSGVNQTAPFGTVAFATGIGDTPTVNASSSSGQIVVDVVSAHRGTALGAGSNQTQHWSLIQGDQAPRMGGGSRENGSLTTTMSWNSAGIDNWVIIAVPVKP